MKTIRRWLKNLKWLFNHPPVNSTATDRHAVCEFCGSLSDVWSFHDGDITTFAICYPCFWKTFRKVLAPPKKKAK
jgi:hypothetical protein